MNIITKNFNKNTKITKENADVYVENLKGLKWTDLLKRNDVMEYLVNSINETKYFTTRNANNYFRTIAFGDPRFSCLVFVIPDEYVSTETHNLIGSPYKYNSVHYGDLFFSIRNDHLISAYGLTFCLFGMYNTRKKDISDSFKDFLKLDDCDKAVMLDRCKEVLKHAA
jgi:hypothetical protein